MREGLQQDAGSAEHGRTRRIAEYGAGALGAELPAEVIEKAKHHILDTLGAIVSGTELAAGVAGHAYVGGLGGAPRATVIAAGFKASLSEAALANAMAAHADETDDAHPASITHPGCSIVPAALAMSEHGGATGLDFLKAVVLGYDICGRTGIMLGGTRFLTERGFDPHAFGGTMGAAAAAGALVCRDDTERMAYVLSYAAQQASGLATVFRDRDHIEKAFVFAGMPARDGVSAAAMVQSGMTGVANVFDGTPSFLSAFGVADAGVFDTLGDVYEITRTNIKRWSVGSPAQAILDSLEVLLGEQRVHPGAVERIEIYLPRDGARVVNNSAMPSVNVQHLAALMIVDGAVGFASSHDHARMSDPEILKVRSKVTLHADEALTQAQPARQGIVELILADGRQLRHHTRHVRGTTLNPMTSGQVATKAIDLMAPVLGDRRARAVAEAVWRLETLPSVSVLTDLLVSRPGDVLPGGA